MYSSMLVKHGQTDKCNKSTDRRLRRIDVEMAARCDDMDFSMYREENMVEGLATFKYIGRTLDQTNDD